MTLAGTTHRGRIDFEILVSFGRGHVECSDRLPCNELSRHKTDVEPSSAPNIECEYLVSRCSRRAVAWRRYAARRLDSRLDDRSIPRLIGIRPLRVNAFPPIARAFRAMKVQTSNLGVLK
jgi:hypothetical protein